MYIQIMFSLKDWHWLSRSILEDKLIVRDDARRLMHFNVDNSTHKSPEFTEPAGLLHSQIGVGDAIEQRSATFLKEPPVRPQNQSTFFQRPQKKNRQIY